MNGLSLAEAATQSTPVQNTPSPSASHPMLLMAKDPLLRRTVVLTARTLSIAHIHETSNHAAAKRMLDDYVYRGAIIALDFGERRYAQYDFSLIDVIRESADPSCREMPIAVLVEYCDAILLQELRHRKVTRVILKPFRARTLLDTFSEFKTQQQAIRDQAA